MYSHIIKFGLPIGLVIIGTNIISMTIGLGMAWLGFLVMLLAFSVIYIALRNLRDDQLGGVITFSRALTTGLGITFVASLAYVFIWELYLLATDYAFIHDYAASILEQQTASGATDAEIAETQANLADLKSQYAKLTHRLPMTLLEIFPMGALVSVVCALAVKRGEVDSKEQAV